MYTPRYDTFGDVKRAVRSLLFGAEKDREMVTRGDKRMVVLYALAIIAGYVGIAIGYVIIMAKLVYSIDMALIAIMLFLLSAVGAFLAIMFGRFGY